MDRNREKKLIKNTGILAIGQLSSKIFTFFLLPLYTMVLVPDDYGTVDMLQTVISLILYLLTLQIESAVFRFLIESRSNQEQQRKYITSGIIVVSLSASLFTVGVIIVSLFFNIPYLLLFILALWAQAFYFFLSSVARGMGNNFSYSVASFLVVISSLMINIFLILGAHLGAQSILIALIVSNIIGGFFLLIKEKLYHIFSISSFSKIEVKKMLSYSIPLIPNAVSWWIANASDRLLILAFLGASMNGIYAAANKIPTIYTTIFSVFNLAWSESVSLSMSDKDKAEYINGVMNRSYKFFSFINLGIICSMSLVFDFLIGPDYSYAYGHVYILLIAIFFNSMCSLLGGVLTGFKDSKAIGATTVMGAIVNIILNLIMIKQIGLYAASISTLISYVLIYLFRKNAVCKHIKYKLSIRFSIQLIFITMLVTTGYFIRNYIFNIVILFVLIVWGIVNNREMIMPILKRIKKKNPKCNYNMKTNL